jgi:hypothetical protein
MDKKIGYEVIVSDVDGFSDARRWMYRMIGAGVAKCGQCSRPATHIFWQDQAEFYIRCDEHPEIGEQWTGSTRWRPESFGMNVITGQALDDWIASLPPEEQAQVSVHEYDATDYYALMTEDMARTRHYFVGDESQVGYIVYADVYPLTNGAFAYQIHKGHYSANGSGRGWTELIRGMWPTEAEALDAAKAELDPPLT